MKERNGEWIIEPKRDTAIVFVHGLLSSGESCWRSDSAYWPELVSTEEQLSGIGVYVFSYETSLFSGSYSAGDAIESLHAHLELDQILKLKNVIFVCHSMGGIIVRQLLVTRATELIEQRMRIGLFLVA